MRKVTHTHRYEDLSTVAGGTVVQKEESGLQVVHGAVDVGEGGVVLLRHVVQLEECLLETSVELSWRNHRCHINVTYANREKVGQDICPLRFK